MDDTQKNKLTPDVYHIAVEKGTEAPFSGKYTDCHDEGTYRCAVCGNELFSSATKFDSGTGWPSFTDAATGTSVKTASDTSHGMTRTEATCGKCGAHLGHVFDDGPKQMPDNTPASGKRFCINSTVLELVRRDNERNQAHEKGEQK